MSITNAEIVFEKAMLSFGFTKGQKIAIAVSGGADSMALSLLANNYAKKHDLSLIAFIVNHQLRPTATHEANITAKRLESIGIQTEILVWKGEKPVTGIEQKARNERYRLLEMACKKHQCTDLLLGHHRFDLAETYFIRKSNQSGEMGLAGMSAVRKTNFGRILRPLLAIYPNDLKQINKENNLDWVEDETNHSLDFERGRLRQSLCLQDYETGFNQAIFYGKKRQELEQQAFDFINKHAEQSEMGWIRFDYQQFLSISKPVQMYCLGLFLRLTANRDYPAKTTSLSRLLEAFKQADFKKSTLSGCCIALSRKNKLLIWREPNDLPPALCVENKQSFIWDRFQFFLSEPLPFKAIIAPFKNAYSVKTNLPKQTFSSIPAIFNKEGLFIVPHLEYKRNNIEYRVTLVPENTLRFQQQWVCPIT